MYMSPEAMDGGTASPTMDVWSLTLMINEILSGEEPFSTARSMGHIRQMIESALR